MKKNFGIQLNGDMLSQFGAGKKSECRQIIDGVNSCLNADKQR